MNSTPNSTSGAANGQHSPRSAAAPRARRRRLGPRIVGLALGSLLGLLVPLMLIVYLRSGGQMPELTPQRLEAARSQWQAHGPSAYAMDLRIGGRQPGVVHIEVHDDQPTAMTRDGVTPKRRASWSAWTVPNMLDTLEIELAGAANPERGFGAPPQARVIERADFDPETGYPRAYERFILGTSLDMSWQVVSFTALPKSAAATKK
ncbi:MAG TPA: hypothetical protein VHV55_08330 [Pirellulales bacterium]|nr:hypothetical protein [Pirellulales bacterium]